MRRAEWRPRGVLIILDVATVLGLEPLARAGAASIESIRQRGRELARRTAPWRALPAVAELAEVSQALTTRGAPR
ncbi:hypothetical protein ThrDRAFT_03468 [Frankia casuarinae]|nr:hypothetical protein [Frankia casuarinae]EYT90888.1 hypothetical protein ThrDRAFT_03468 [Frankia casuarinae]